MVPQKLVDLLIKESLGLYERIDSEKVSKTLQSLGIEADSQIYEFYTNYMVCVSNAKLQKTDLNEVNMFVLSTFFIRETWGLPENFVCLSSVEGEGCYLYDKETGKVCDFDLADREAFLSGEIKQEWPDFYSFMEWYLSE